MGQRWSGLPSCHATACPHSEWLQPLDHFCAQASDRVYYLYQTMADIAEALSSSPEGAAALEDAQRQVASAAAPPQAQQQAAEASAQQQQEPTGKAGKGGKKAAAAAASSPGVELLAEVRAALADDFNTPLAIAALSAPLKAANDFLHTKKVGLVWAGMHWPTSGACHACGGVEETLPRNLALPARCFSSHSRCFSCSQSAPARLACHPQTIRRARRRLAGCRRWPPTKPACRRCWSCWACGRSSRRPCWGSCARWRSRGEGRVARLGWVGGCE